MSSSEKPVLVPVWLASLIIAVVFGWIAGDWKNTKADQRDTAASVSAVGSKLEVATMEIKGSLATLETAVRLQMQDHSRRIENLERDRDRRIGWPSSMSAVKESPR